MKIGRILISAIFGCGVGFNLGVFIYALVNAEGLILLPLILPILFSFLIYRYLANERIELRGFIISTVLGVTIGFFLGLVIFAIYKINVFVLLPIIFSFSFPIIFYRIRTISNYIKTIIFCLVIIALGLMLLWISILVWMERKVSSVFVQFLLCISLSSWLLGAGIYSLLKVRDVATMKYEIKVIGKFKVYVAKLSILLLGCLFVLASMGMLIKILEGSKEVPTWLPLLFVSYGIFLICCVIDANIMNSILTFGGKIRF